MAHMVLKGQCPNCGKDVTDDRLARGLPCEVCLPDPPPSLQVGNLSKLELLREVCKALSSAGKGGRLFDLLKEERLHEFEEFFEKALGSRPWSAQRTWAKRVLRGTSFTILASTGVGKTVFGMEMSLFLASRGKRCYLLMPTSLLVKQAVERLNSHLERLGVRVRVLAYLTQGRRDRSELLERIRGGEYDVLVTTSQFLSRNFNLLSNARFDFIFVDDVDSILKSSKIIDKVLALLGVPQQVVAEAMDIIVHSARRRGASEGEAEYGAARERLKQLLTPLRVGTLVVSTATGRPRGLRVKLFREILGFEVGSRAELLRNIVNAYMIASSGNLEERVAEIVARLGKGGLVFLLPGWEERVGRLLELLEGRGLRARLVTSKSKKELEAFERGEVDVLLGYATYYGLLVRGIDLPHVIRYAVFADVPHFKFSAEIEEAGPVRLLQLAQTLRSVMASEEAARMDRLVSSLRRYLLNLEPRAYQKLAEALASGTRPDGFLGYLYDLVLELRQLLRELVARRELLGELESRTLASLRSLNGRTYILLPDAYTYLQASGRTSRMYAGGLSKGLSIVVATDEKLLNALMRQVRWYVEDASWVKLEELDLDRVMEEVEGDRRVIKELMEGKVVCRATDAVKTALVVVESPTKARTIASFFSKPSMRLVCGLPVYEVSTGNLLLQIAASKGHVSDLVTIEGFWGVKTDRSLVPIYTTVKRCLDCLEQFTETKGELCPRCRSSRVADQLSVVEALRRVSSEVDLVLLATDPDTEGEKIAWDLYVLLRPYSAEVRRIEFHEVTRRAFEEALRNPKDVDLNRVRAQLVRRVEDRWIGFSLSKKLWESFEKQWLSAGRVQTPTLGWVIERYREAKRSVKRVFYLMLENGLTVTLETDLPAADARALAKELREATAVIERIKVEEVRVRPPPPFTTDSLLRESTQRLGVGVEKVMRLAQDLFEMGFITYHRTDSAHVSATGIALARSYIAEKFGEGIFVGCSWGPPGTHECIRPTKPYDVETLKALVSNGVLIVARQLTHNHYRLYDLIFHRFVASQMREAVVRVEALRVIAGLLSRELSVYSDVVERGFLTAYQPFTITRIEPGTYRVVDVRHRRGLTLRLYTQADLVARMKEEGIGRPSTYAKIVVTLLERRYVIETKRHRLVPTKLGIDVFEYLSTNFEDMVSVRRTRTVEEMMDKVERGEVDYQGVLQEFYEEVKEVA